MLKWFLRCGGVCAALFLMLAAHAADYIWLEAENPTRENVTTTPADAPNPQFISGGKWLNYTVGEGDVQKTVPKEGALFSYDFTANTAGAYEVWMRQGFISLRKPFQWRIDQGEWKQKNSTDSTPDMMRLAEWVEVAWLKLGSANLTAGAHTLQIGIPLLPDAYTGAG